MEVEAEMNEEQAKRLAEIASYLLTFRVKGDQEQPALLA
jgi:hypothetical protein